MVGIEKERKYNFKFGSTDIVVSFPNNVPFDGDVTIVFSRLGEQFLMKEKFYSLLSILSHIKGEWHREPDREPYYCDGCSFCMFSFDKFCERGDPSDCKHFKGFDSDSNKVRDFVGKNKTCAECKNYSPISRDWGRCSEIGSSIDVGVNTNKCKNFDPRKPVE